MVGMFNKTNFNLSGIFPLVAMAISAGVLVGVAGCEIVGVMAASAYREGSHDVYEEYDGLTGKSFVVLVAADRMIQSEHPRIVGELTNNITQRIIAHADVSGFVPAPVVAQFQYDTPQWPAMPYSDIAEHFGVERIVFVDLYDFRLHEPGNQYLWSGVAAATLGIVEADSVLPDEFIFTKDITVQFPDAAGYSRSDFPAAAVSSTLRKRMVDRVAWLFYEHEEKNILEY